MDQRVELSRDELLEEFKRNIGALKPIQRVRAIEKLCTMWGWQMDEDVAKHIGRSRAWVYPYRRVLKLHPELLHKMELCKDGSPSLNMVVALELVRVEDQATQLELFKKIPEDLVTDNSRRLWVNRRIESMHPRDQLVLNSRALGNRRSVRNFVRSTNNRARFWSRLPLDFSLGATPGEMEQLIDDVRVASAAMISLLQRVKDDANIKLPLPEKPLEPIAADAQVGLVPKPKIVQSIQTQVVAFVPTSVPRIYRDAPEKVEPKPAESPTVPMSDVSVGVRPRRDVAIVRSLPRELAKSQKTDVLPVTEITVGAYDERSGRYASVTVDKEGLRALLKDRRLKFQGDGTAMPPHIKEFLEKT